MAKFRVTYTETWKKYIVVEADDETQAIDLVEEMASQGIEADTSNMNNYVGYKVLSRVKEIK